MALTLPIPLTIGADVLSLPRINQDGHAGYYFDRKSDSTLVCDVKIAHTLPKKADPTSKESHLIRMDVGHYDGAGALLRNEAVWTVLQTTQGVQNDTSLLNNWLAMNVWLEATTNAAMSAILGRELG